MHVYMRIPCCDGAAPPPGLRVEQRNLHKLRQLLIKHRAELAAAYAKADEPGTKRLPMARWASLTGEVLRASFPILVRVRVRVRVGVSTHPNPN